jgi:hypothetical protein
MFSNLFYPKRETPNYLNLFSYKGCFATNMIDFSKYDENVFFLSEFQEKLFPFSLNENGTSTKHVANLIELVNIPTAIMDIFGKFYFGDLNTLKYYITYSVLYYEMSVYDYAVSDPNLRVIEPLTSNIAYYETMKRILKFDLPWFMTNVADHAINLYDCVTYVDSLVPLDDMFEKPDQCVEDVLVAHTEFVTQIFHSEFVTPSCYDICDGEIEVVEDVPFYSDLFQAYDANSADYDDLENEWCDNASDGGEWNGHDLRDDDVLSDQLSESDKEKAYGLISSLFLNTRIVSDDAWNPPLPLSSFTFNCLSHINTTCVPIVSYNNFSDEVDFYEGVHVSQDCTVDVCVKFCSFDDVYQEDDERIYVVSGVRVEQFSNLAMLNNFIIPVNLVTGTFVIVPCTWRVYSLFLQNISTIDPLIAGVLFSKRTMIVARNLLGRDRSQIHFPEDDELFITAAGVLLRFHETGIITGLPNCSQELKSKTANLRKKYIRYVRHLKAPQRVFSAQAGFGCGSPFTKSHKASPDEFYSYCVTTFMRPNSSFFATGFTPPLHNLPSELLHGFEPKDMYLIMRDPIFLAVVCGMRDLNIPKSDFLIVEPGKYPASNHDKYAEYPYSGDIKAKILSSRPYKMAVWERDFHGFISLESVRTNDKYFGWFFSVRTRTYSRLRVGRIYPQYYVCRVPWGSVEPPNRNH